MRRGSQWARSVTGAQQDIVSTENPPKRSIQQPSPEARRASLKACYWCGTAYRKGDNLWGRSLEHVLPRALGGPDKPSNIVYAHIKCNSDRGCNMNWIPFWEHRKVGQREVRT